MDWRDALRWRTTRSPDDLLAFERVADGERLLWLNLGERSARWTPPHSMGHRLIETVVVADGELGPFAGFIAVLDGQEKA